MSAVDWSCAACCTCPDCGRRWCREQEVSPSELEHICADCHDAREVVA